MPDYAGGLNTNQGGDLPLVFCVPQTTVTETSFGSYAKKRYRFCGKEKDEESGFYYYGMRYYSAWTCRFISVDPLADKYAYQSPYPYASNKPINYTDIDGAETPGQPPSPGSTGKSNPTSNTDAAKTTTNNQSSNSTTTKTSTSTAQNSLLVDPNTIKPKTSTQQELDASKQFQRIPTPSQATQMGTDLQNQYKKTIPPLPTNTNSGTDSKSSPEKDLIAPTVEETGKATEKTAEYAQKQLREEEGLLGASNGKNYQSSGKTKPDNPFETPRWKEKGNQYFTTENYMPNTKLTNGLKLIAKGAQYVGPILDSYALSEVIRGRAETYTLLPLSFVFEDFSNEVDRELLKVAINEGYEATSNYVSSRPSSKTGLQMAYVNQEDYLGLLSGQFSSLSEVKSLGDMQQGYAVLIQQQGKSFGILAGFKFK